MKNFVQPGVSIDVLPAADVKSGDLVVVGTMFGIAYTDALAGTPVSLATGGVYELAKKTGAGKSFTAGAAVYWDTAQKKCDVAAGAGLVKVGVATEASAEASESVKVRLNASF